MSKPTRGRRTFRKAFPILKCLSVSEDRTPYAIERELKIERHTVLDSLSSMEKAGLVKISDRKKLPTHHEKKLYRITPRGIVALLQGHPEYINLRNQDIRDIAEKQTTFLPLVFGKWDYFRQRGVEQLACKFLLIAARRNTDSEVNRLIEWIEAPQKAANLKLSTARFEDPTIEEIETSEPVHRHNIYESMLVDAWANDPNSEEGEKWLQVVRDDEELVRMTEREIERLRDDEDEHRQFLEDCLEMLQGRKPVGAVIIAPSFSESERIDEETENVAAVKVVLEYSRMKALDEGKPMPKLRDLLIEAIEMEKGRKGKG